MMTPYQKAVAAQSEAANPAETRMVSANAGSGKTRVLVDRVSRILLQGVDPEKILCLTYTKAAATEMQDRLYAKLGGWSILNEKDLQTELYNLLGEEFHDIDWARSLFAKALETPEGLKVQTIHAFCERVLSRFPIEAGILPGFKPIDDTEKASIAQEARQSILTMAMEDPDGEINQALQTLTLKMADQTLDGLFYWMSVSGEKIEQWKDNSGTEALSKKLGLKPDDTRESLIAGFWADTDRETLEAAIPIIESGTKTDKVSAIRIRESLAMGETVEAFYHYAVIFLANKGESIRKNPVTLKTMEATQDYFSAAGDEAARVFAFFKMLKAINVLKFTEAIFTLAAPYAEAFAKAKRDRRVLDFNDQIILVKDLLSKKAVSEWVLYKLDGGIEHILLDEAQDTSPDQWSIINHLSEAFIQDNPDRNSKYPRTLFAVGDEKQSIYGFQGAKPEQFLREIQTRLTGDAKQVRMAMSFRSSQTVLDVVDAFLNDQGGRLAMFDAESFPPSADMEPHTANREGEDEGFVEFWPLSLKPEKGDDNAPWDTTPVDVAGEGNEREVLAQKLAKQIKEWLDRGESIYDRALECTRPMNAGDILILVRTRGGRNNSLFDAIIRHLKRESIPIAGADSISLTDAMIVRDLLALSRFVLLPSDDLSLAEILKGPIFGLDDMAVLELAKGRKKKSLWASIQERDPDLTKQIKALLGLSRGATPYEFYTGVLDYIMNDGESLRRKFFKRLGLESREALEVFLGRAMDHQQNGVPSLLHFVRGFDGDDTTVKRDMDSAKGHVRVMTVHGAKGLEAPVVILPDTTSCSTYKETLVPIEKGFFFKLSQSEMPDALKPFITAGANREAQEELRLLYVALTRAESRLIICGHEGGRGKQLFTKNSWYDWMSRTFEGLKTDIIETPFGEGQSFGKPPKALGKAAQQSEDMNFDLPDWVNQQVRKERPISKRLSPSHLLASADGYALQEAPITGLTPRQRGNVIHQLLEVLPNYAQAQRLQKVDAIIRAYPEVTTEEQETIRAEVFQVLDAPEFQFLWAEGSQAEVSLAGQISAVSQSVEFSGKIDRLCVGPEEILIVDFKSNQDVPQSEDDIEDVYWGQMAAYQALVQQLHPNKRVKCGLLWTADPKMMWLSSQKLEHALTKIESLPNYGQDTDLRLA